MSSPKQHAPPRRKRKKCVPPTRRFVRRQLRRPASNIGPVVLAFRCPRPQLHSAPQLAAAQQARWRVVFNTIRAQVQVRQHAARSVPA